jgi:hypothetical protein
MTTSIEQMLNALGTSAPGGAFAKTASEQFAEGLVERSALEKLSTAELAALALQFGDHEDPETEKVAQETSDETSDETTEDVDEQEKLAAAEEAYDNFLSQGAAHAAMNEVHLVKFAMANGYCRVCKENPMDLSGSSICSACLSEEV